MIKNSGFHGRWSPALMLSWLALRWNCHQAGELLLFLALFLSTPVHSNELAPLFANNWLIEATIEAPIGRIMQHRSEKEEQDGQFSYMLPDGRQQVLDIKVRVRGGSRAREEVCDFAPLRLNFRKKQVAGTEFEGQDKLKLVTHCQNKGIGYEQLLLKEFLTYQILTTITGNAFRTRLLRITYVDSEGASQKRTRFAFLIEHRKNLATRINMKFIEVDTITVDQLDEAQTNLVSVYSYLIGNTDFSAMKKSRVDRCCHNVELIEDKTGRFLPIPYDFDSSGIVDAPYALPHPKLGIKKVTFRLYRGLCKNNELLDNTFALMKEHHAELTAMIDNFEPLSGTSRKKMKKYVDRFYKEIDSERQVEKHFTKGCSAAPTPSSAV